MEHQGFLEAVRTAYEAAGLSQKEFAAKAEVRDTSLNAILKGRTNLSLKMAKTLAKASGVDMRLYWDEVTPPAATSGFVEIPLREAAASMGPGAFEDSRKIRTYLAFREDWAYSKGNPKKMSGIRAWGTSMSPTIPSGCIVLIDESQIEKQNGRIYYLRLNDGLHIKRLKKIKDTWFLESDEDGSLIEIHAHDSFEIFGRALWYGCEL